MQRYNNQDSFDYSKQLNQIPFEEIIQQLYSMQERKNLNLTQQEEAILNNIIAPPQMSKVSPRIKKSKPNNYPTKNCLALFKSAHFAFLQRKKIAYQKFSQLALLKLKNGAAREDFIMLYKIEQLRSVWKQMLLQKFIYRYVMISRALSLQKKNFISRIKAVQKAFHKLEFQRLNDKW